MVSIKDLCYQFKVEERIEELEETLIMSDIGMETSLDIIGKLRQKRNWLIIERDTCKEELEAKGMEVKMQSSDSLSKNYIAVHNLDIAGDTITELKKTIPSLKDNHTIYDPIGINRAGKDITIVISDL